MICFLRIGSDELERAKKYRSLKRAIAAYREVASDLARFGQEITATVHFADSRDTLTEYPDRLLSLGRGGGVKVELT